MGPFADLYWEHASDEARSCWRIDAGKDAVPTLLSQTETELIPGGMALPTSLNEYFLELVEVGLYVGDKTVESIELPADLLEADDLFGECGSPQAAGSIDDLEAQLEELRDEAAGLREDSCDEDAEAIEAFCANCAELIAYARPRGYAITIGLE